MGERMSSRCSGILIVENDNESRESLKDFFELEGYVTHTATNGKEALKVLETIDEPGVILLDLMMPEMNGWEFLEARKTLGSSAKVPVVILTSTSTTQIQSLQPNSYIRKPVDLTELFKVVQNFCGGPSA